MGEADFNQFMRLRNQLVNAAENFARGENLTPVVIPTVSRDMNELTHTGSQGSRRCGSRTQKDLCDTAAVQCGQA